ncbi:MAG: CHAT domain-containing protein, partial [bacterium]
QNLVDAGVEGIEIARDIGAKSFLAGFYLDVAFAYEKMDDLQRALKFCELALQAVRESPDQNVESAAHFAIGRLYFALNEPERALEHLEQSREIARKGGRSNTRHLALLNQADVYKLQGRIQEAKTAYKQVLRYAQRMQRHHLTETCFVKLADLYLNSDPPDMNSVTYYFNLANALARQTFQLQFGANHRWMQGKQALMQNSVEKAETLFQEAIQLGKESGSYLSLIAGQAGLIRTYLAANIPDLAAAYSDSALNSLATFFDHCQQENTIGLFDLRKDLFEPAISAFTEVGELEEIYRATELYKALGHNLALNKVKYVMSSAMVDSIMWKVDLVSRKIDEEWEDLWQVWNNDRSDHLELVTSHKMEIDKLKREKNRQLSRIKQRYADDYDMLFPKAETLNNLKKELVSLNATFVHYFVGDSATFVTVVQPDGIACRRINVTEEWLTKSVKLISPLLEHQEEQAEFPPTDLNLFRVDLAGYVYELIFEPIRDLIAPESLVIISPDKILKKLPFETLVTNRDELTDSYDYKSARFLIEDFAVAYIPYARFVGLRRDKDVKSKKTLVAFANSSLHIKTSSFNKIYSDGKVLDDEADLRKKTNPFGRAEVQLFCGQLATKSQFIRESPNYQIVHFNLPYTANDKSPLYSRINFTDSEQSQGGLEAHVLFNQRLSADLVVLDGIKNQNPGTTPDGLFHGFNYAGVPSMLTSLWWSDNAKLLEDFYLKLKLGMTKAEALREAKVKYLTEVSRNPLHWAALVLAGDTEAIVFESNSKYWIIYITLIGVAIFLTAIVRQILKIKSAKTISEV